MSLTCPQCGETVESTDDLEEDEFMELEIGEGGAISVYGSEQTFYRCRACRKAMGVGHSK